MRVQKSGREIEGRLSLKGFLCVKHHLQAGKTHLLIHLTLEESELEVADDQLSDVHLPRQYSTVPNSHNLRGLHPGLPDVLPRVERPRSRPQLVTISHSSSLCRTMRTRMTKSSDPSGTWSTSARHIIKRAQECTSFEVQCELPRYPCCRREL